MFGQTFVPTKAFFTKGLGRHKNKLQSFELALRDAGIEKLDLVSKQELDRQRTALNLANQRLRELQQQMKTLEEMVQNKK